MSMYKFDNIFIVYAAIQSLWSQTLLNIPLQCYMIYVTLSRALLHTMLHTMLHESCEFPLRKGGTLMCALCNIVVYPNLALHHVSKPYVAPCILTLHRCFSLCQRRPKIANKVGLQIGREGLLQRRLKSRNVSGRRLQRKSFVELFVDVTKI